METRIIPSRDSDLLLLFPSLMRTNVISTCRKPCTAVRYSTHRRLQRSIIAEKNPSVNAFVSVSQEQSTEILDSSLPLSNVSIAVKDNIATRLLPTTCSSAMLKGVLLKFNLWNGIDKSLQNTPLLSMQRW